MNTSIMDESPLFQEWKERVAREGAREAARIVLESRFGPLDPAFVAALDAADTATLRALMPYLATETLEQLRARLQTAETNAETNKTADSGDEPA
jgi:hypothetical protein